MMRDFSAVPLHQSLAQSLPAFGVDVLYGLVGDANLFLVDAYCRAGGRYVGCTHEANAVLAAIGAAQASNKIGVATITHGPALTNVVTALTEAAKGGVPLVVLCGDTAPGDNQHLQKVTLGIICRAVLQLKPYRPNSALALVALRDHAAALDCLSSLRERFDTDLIAFEGMWPDYWQLVCCEARIARSPLEGTHGFYALLEIELQQGGTPDALEEWLLDALEQDLVRDGVLAQSLAEHRSLWAIREAVGEIDDHLGPHINFDIGIAPARLGNFCLEVETILDEMPEALRNVKVGHVGDGNVHLLVSHDQACDTLRIEQAVYDLVRRYSGAVTAEHGVGRLKVAWLPASRSDTERKLMASIKNCIDPRNLMNPGVVMEPQVPHKDTFPV